MSHISGLEDNEDKVDLIKLFVLVALSVCCLWLCLCPLPVVQKDAITHEVIAVVTPDGISHPASYFFEQGFEEKRYETVWVRPKAMDGDDKY